MAVVHRKNLLPYQRDAVAWGLAKQEVGYLMDLRLGKTLIASRWAEQWSTYKVLVVAPKSVVPVWQEHLSQEGHPGWTVTNYERLTERGHRTPGGKSKAVASQFLEEINPDVVILDEVTRIRNPKAQVTKVVHTYLGSVPFRCILTGWLLPQDYFNLYEPMKFLVGGAFMGCRTFWQWRRRYFDQADEWGSEWFPKPGTLDAVAQAIGERCLTMHRKDVGMEKQAVYLKRYIELPLKQKKAYHDIERTMMWGEASTNYKMGTRQWLRQLTEGTLANCEWDGPQQELVNLLQGDLSAEPVIVWFAHLKQLWEVEGRLKLTRIPCAAITGATSSMQRVARLRGLGKKYRVLLCMVQCFKYGVDASAASAAVYMSNSEDPEDRVQSEGRLIHPKKDDCLLYIDIIPKGTIAEDIYEALVVKKLTGRAFLNSVKKHAQERWTRGRTW